MSMATFFAALRVKSIYQHPYEVLFLIPNINTKFNYSSFWDKYTSIFENCIWHFAYHTMHMKLNCSSNQPLLIGQFSKRLAITGVCDMLERRSQKSLCCFCHFVELPTHLV